MKNFGYIRCSTPKEKGRQDTARQKRDIELAARGEKVYFYEDYLSGSKVDRTNYIAMLSDIEKAISIGETDISIYCTEVSRLSRSTKQLIDLIDFVKENNLRLVVGNFILDCRVVDNKANSINPMAMAMLQMMGIFAELERSITVERINSGLENARAKGVQLGRKETTVDDIPKKFFKYYDQYKDKKISVAEFARLCEMSRTTIYKYIRLLEVKK